MTLVSDRYRLAFVKTHKTAGTSIEIDLSTHLEADAIVTPIIPAVEGHEPRNFQDEAGEAKFRNHMSAAQLREALGAQRFANLFVFCVEREPVAKCLSHYHMLKYRTGEGALPEGEREALSWAGYVEAGRFPVDDWRYEDPDRPGTLLVNEILAYEDLATTLPALLARHGIVGFELKARAKSEYSQAKDRAPVDVTASQRRVIYDRFARSLALSGFENRWQP